jgi:hypothetical protein
MATLLVSFGVQNEMPGPPRQRRKNSSSDEVDKIPTVITLFAGSGSRKKVTKTERLTLFIPFINSIRVTLVQHFCVEQRTRIRS